MVFPSFSFLFFFFPAVVGLYFLLPRAAQNLFLALASLGFYAWAGSAFLPVLLASCLLDFAIGNKLHALTGERKSRLLYVSLSIASNLALLAYFKYSNFFVDQINACLVILGLPAFGWTKVVLPLGISFVVLHKISYSVDLYRQVSSRASGFVDYLLYILFFPQLIAGPIVRFHEIEAQIRSRKVVLDDLYWGVTRFTIGLGKKVILADPMGLVADHVFRLHASALSFSVAWLGVAAYAFQIYYDFSGYSDMAIGLARIFGFRFPENFSRPYCAASVTEFWRRWHLSLSRWMKDYVYLPLGGSRGGSLKTFRNLWIVFLLSGLWHGASWNFVLWGLFHGTFLFVERLTSTKDLPKMLLSWVPRGAKILWTRWVLCLSWVLFRSSSVSKAGVMLGYLCNPAAYGERAGQVVPAMIINNHGVFIFCLCVFFIGAVEPVQEYGREKILETVRRFSPFSLPVRESSVLAELTRSCCLAFILLFSLMMLSTSSYRPFIYFQF